VGETASEMRLRSVVGKPPASFVHTGLAAVAFVVL
jgi:hypothetical protein